MHDTHLTAILKSGDPSRPIILKNFMYQWLPVMGMVCVIPYEFNYFYGLYLNNIFPSKIVLNELFTTQGQYMDKPMSYFDINFITYLRSDYITLLVTTAAEHVVKKTYLKMCLLATKTGE
jgi:hypothetical protein